MSPDLLRVYRNYITSRTVHATIIGLTIATYLIPVLASGFNAAIIVWIIVCGSLQLAAVGVIQWHLNRIRTYGLGLGLRLGDGSEYTASRWYLDLPEHRDTALRYLWNAATIDHIAAACTVGMLTILVITTGVSDLPAPPLSAVATAAIQGATIAGYAVTMVWVLVQISRNEEPDVTITLRQHQ